MAGPDMSAAVALVGTTAHHSLVQQHVQTSLLNSSPSALTHALAAASSAHSLASLSSARADVLFPSLLSALSSNPEAAAHAVAVAARDAPPALLRQHWPALARKTAAALKGAQSQAPLLAALAALIAAAETYPALGGSAVAAVAAVAESALSHALRVLADADETSTAEDELAAIALAAAVAHVAPSQVRTALVSLSDVLWAPGRGVSSPYPFVRFHSAALLAELPVCHPAKARGGALITVVLRAAKELDDLRHSLSMFQSRDSAVTAPVPLPQHAQQPPSALAARFTTMADLLCACLCRHFPEPLAFPVHKLVDVLTRILAFTVLDPYALPTGRHIDVTAVAALLPRIRADSLRALSTIVRALGRPALLPFAREITRPVAHCLANASRSSATVSSQDLVAGVSERAHAYKAAISCISVLGSPAVDAMVGPLATALALDIPAASTVSAPGYSSSAHAFTSQPLRGLAPHARPAKRRRHIGNSGATRQDDQEERRNARESFASAEYDPVELHGIHATQASLAIVGAVTVGLTAFQGVLSSRSFMSDDTVRSVIRVESLVVAALPSARGEFGCSLVRLVAASALSGGSGRMRGRASPIIVSAMSALRALIRSPSAEGKLALEARVALASCEALAHPKGPPVILISAVESAAASRLGGVIFDQAHGDGQVQSAAKMLHSLPRFETGTIKPHATEEPEAMEEDCPPSAPQQKSIPDVPMSNDLYVQVEAQPGVPDSKTVLQALQPEEAPEPGAVEESVPAFAVQAVAPAFAAGAPALAAGASSSDSESNSNKALSILDQDAEDQDAEDQDILNSLVFD
jgi:hypothetical protein